MGGEDQLFFSPNSLFMFAKGPSTQCLHRHHGGCIADVSDAETSPRCRCHLAPPRRHGGWSFGCAWARCVRFESEKLKKFEERGMKWNTNKCEVWRWSWHFAKRCLNGRKPLDVLPTNSSEVKLWKPVISNHYKNWRPKDPCIVYLPVFGWLVWQLLVGWRYAIHGSYEI